MIDSNILCTTKGYLKVLLRAQNLFSYHYKPHHGLDRGRDCAREEIVDDGSWRYPKRPSPVPSV
jgi:hypothetical protein